MSVMRIAAVIVAWVGTALVLACGGPPPLVAPADLLPEDEPVFMHAHLDKFKLALRDNLDRHYDDKYQVEFEYSRLTAHIDRWHEQIGHPKRWGDGPPDHVLAATQPGQGPPDGWRVYWWRASSIRVTSAWPTPAQRNLQMDGPAVQ